VALCEPGFFIFSHRATKVTKNNGNISPQKQEVPAPRRVSLYAGTVFLRALRQAPAGSRRENIRSPGNVLLQEKVAISLIRFFRFFEDILLPFNERWMFYSHITPPKKSSFSERIFVLFQAKNLRK